MNYKIKRLSDNCIEVRCVYKVGFSQDFFLSADWHLDNPKCNRKLLTNHLNEAKEKEAGIFVTISEFLNRKADSRKIRDLKKAEETVNSPIND